MTTKSLANPKPCILMPASFRRSTLKWQARKRDLHGYSSRIPVYCSFVGFGEFFNVAGKKLTQKRIGIAGYLFSCRALMNNQAMGTIRRVEPVEDRVQFIQLARRLEAKFSQLGGGDVWHLMSAIQLQSHHKRITLFSFDADLVSAAKAEGIQAVCGSGLDRDLVAEELKKYRKLREN